MSGPSAVERGLARVVDSRPGEMPGLLAAFAYHFLLFTAYSILKPIRTVTWNSETWFPLIAPRISATSNQLMFFTVSSIISGSFTGW